MQNLTKAIFVLGGFPELACDKVKPFSCHGCMGPAGFREGWEEGGRERVRGRRRSGGGGKVGGGRRRRRGGGEGEVRERRVGGMGGGEVGGRIHMNFV